MGRMCQECDTQQLIHLVAGNQAFFIKETLGQSDKAVITVMNLHNYISTTYIIRLQKPGWITVHHRNRRHARAK